VPEPDSVIAAAPVDEAVIERSGGEAIAPHDYSADERAGRARGAGVAFLSMVAIGAALVAAAVLILLVR
jgi:hypothetical protein